MMSTYLKYFGLIVVLTVFSGCSKKPESKDKPPPPAQVQNPVKETDLTTVTLTTEAESRLGIQTTAVEYRSVEKSRTFGGEVMTIDSTDDGAGKTGCSPGSC